MLQPTCEGDRTDTLEQIRTSIQEMQDAHSSIQQHALLLPCCTAIANDGTGCLNGKNLEAVLLLIEHFKMYLDNELDVFRAELAHVRELLDGLES